MMNSIPSLSVTLHGRTVRLELTFADRETAIAAHDEILAEAQRASPLEIQIGQQKPPTPAKPAE